MASSKTTPIFFADGAADTMSLSIQTEFRVGLERRADEITNNSDLSPFNFKLLCNIINMYVIDTSFKYGSSRLSFNRIS